MTADERTEYWAITFFWLGVGVLTVGLLVYALWMIGVWATPFRPDGAILALYPVPTE